jgi:hypothetical protein
MRRADAPLAVLAGALVALTLARLPAAWESGNALNHVSGAWMALADDLARGTFYRPLHDPGLGYGGTRFFPLAFALHAGVVRLGIPLLPGGQALSLVAGLVLVAAAALLLRRTGASRTAAAAGAALALAGFAGQHALAAVRGDLLAVALQAAGLAVIAGGATRRRVAAGAILFTLAFAAKPTALTAPAAAAAFLLLRGARRSALALAVAVGTGAIATVAATDALSDGRFLELLRACAAGGAGAGDLLRAPLRLARQLAIEDRAGLALAVAAAVTLGVRALAARREGGGVRADGALLPALWVLAAAGGALAVFASPGTGVNHLLELEAASATVLGACLGRTGAAGRTARLAAPAAAAAGLVLAFGLFRTDLASSRLAEARAVVAAAPRGEMLSEDPLVPLLAGERPLLVDGWMLRLAAERDRDLARPLLAAIERGALPAAVLFQDLAAPDADAWYAHGNLGPAVVDALRHHYRLATRIGRYFVYVPASCADERGGGRVVVSPSPSECASTPARAPAPVLPLMVAPTPPG